MNSSSKRIPSLGGNYSRPGFIEVPRLGRSIPVLFILRVMIFVGLIVRFAVYPYQDKQILPWVLLIPSALLILVATRITFDRALLRSKPIQQWLIVADIALISSFYWLSGNIRSELFLFFCLPLLTVTQYFGDRGIAIVTLASCVGIVSVVILLVPSSNFSSLDILEIVVLRAFFIIMLGFLSLRQLERRREISQHEREAQALLDFRREIASLFEVNKILERTVCTAMEIIGASGGHAILLDYETSQLQVRFSTPGDYLANRGSPKGLIRIAERITQYPYYHSIDNVNADHLYSEVFGPSIRSILCVPILSSDTILGVLGIGGNQKGQFDKDVRRFLEALANQAANAIERARLLAALREIGDATAGALELNYELDVLLQELVDDMGLEFATITLVDKYRQTVEMARGLNVPIGWVRRSKYTLDSNDILVDVVRSGKTEVIAGWDNRFNKEIYDRYEHEKFARVFTPLIGEKDEVIGVIESGCKRELKAKLLSEDRVQRVRELGQRRGAQIAIARPYALTEKIADHAVRIIGADSASLHVDQFGQSLLEAGAGKVTADFLRQFPPRPEGIGAQAIQANKPIVLEDSEELKITHRGIYDVGIRAIAAFPLSLGAGVRGVLYVHFWRKHLFSKAEVELEKVFVQQIEVAIQNHLLLSDLATAARKAQTLSELQGVLQSLSSKLALPHVLDEVAQTSLYMLDAHSVTLYQYYQDSQYFETPPIMKGIFSQPAAMKHQMYPDDIVWRILQQNRSLFITNVADEELLIGHQDERDKSRFVEREGIRSCAVLILRVGRASEIVGLMFVNYDEPHEFGHEEENTIRALASSAAIAIQAARLHERVRQDLARREREIKVMHSVDQAIVASARSPDLQPVLELILKEVLVSISVPVGYIAWLTPWKDILTVIAQQGLSQNQLSYHWRVGEGIIGLVAQEKKAMLVHDGQPRWNEMRPLGANTRSILAVPLEDDSSLLGILCVEHQEEDALGEKDQALLEMLSLQAVIAVHSTQLRQQLEQQLKALRALYLIAARIQDARYDLDTVLRLLLTGVTAGQGAGFSRAMLFLLNDEKTHLQGTMAIGSQTFEEADATWKSLNAEALHDSSEDMLVSLLDQAEAFGIAVRQQKKTDCPLSIAVQRIRLPAKKRAGALIQCLTDNRTLLISHHQNDLLRTVIEQLRQANDHKWAFVCVPLIGEGKSPIGVLVADDRFLPREREIDQDRVSFVEAYAGMIAMSIENSRLQHRLAEKQRLITWMDFAASVAHIIGTQISTIEGKVTRLRSNLPEQQNDEAKECLKGLNRGIEKANKVLKRLRQLAAPLELNAETMDLVTIIHDTIQDHIMDYSIETNLIDGPIWINGDALLLSNAFLELIQNAHVAMTSLPTKRSPRISIVMLAESISTVCIEFADTGPGIPKADKNRIFEPFFSRKSQDGGLGLAIVQKIIVQHNGTIEEVGIEGEGARFIVRLPLAKSSFS